MEQEWVNRYNKETNTTENESIEEQKAAFKQKIEVMESITDKFEIINTENVFRIINKSKNENKSIRTILSQEYDINMKIANELAQIVVATYKEKTNQ